MPFRRAAQLICLGLFLTALAGAAAGLLASPDLFLRLDPVLVGATALAGRALVWAFLPAVIVLISALLMGRAFCGHICPMGTTIDGGDRVVGYPRKPPRSGGRLRPIKYYVLAALLGAALAGVSLVFLAAPLSLITRFYGLLVYPVAERLADGGLAAIRPAAEALDLRSLMFAQIDPPRFGTQLFLLAFFGAVFGLARVSPRFWCRYLCPAGALLGAVSGRPLIRRRVGDDCIDCGKCARRCPMDAIPGDAPRTTRYRECIACGTCAAVCPVDAAAFPADKPIRAVFPAGLSTPSTPSTSSTASTPASLERRRILVAGLAGAGTAAVGLTGLYGPYPGAGEGQVQAVGLLRPPSALPEKEFLAQCVRCGECMAACPTNTLQPIGLRAGWMALFSPALTPRRGYCDPRCHRCADGCPTGAIRPVSDNERIWAKTGTAIILRQKCLAWEHKKSCMVCDEVCPYDAIDFRREPGNPYAVPHVREDRCAGCGYCEHFCPVYHEAAIVVTAMGALRLPEGSFKREATGRGLRLTLKSKTDAAAGYPSPAAPSSGGAPGFDEGGSPETAPGFDSGFDDS